MIKAEIIADSLNEHGQRLTTFVLVFPRIVLAEFNTHRMLSRNSASSRAIPFEKMLKMVQENPFVPIRWMKDHKGMQGAEYFEGTDAQVCEYLWKYAAADAARNAKNLSEKGVTKQFCNRLLEAYMWHTAIVTGSEWENFFALRADTQAEIHIQELANQMLEAYNFGEPKQLKAGEWHIPFGDRINLPPTIPIDAGWTLSEGVAIRKVKIATARCARVSYLNFEGKDDYDADIRLHDMLLKSGHMSPFEHCARAMSKEEMMDHYHGTIQWERHSTMDTEHSKTAITNGSGIGWSGNFRGFIQYRKMITGENKTDKRVKKT